MREGVESSQPGNSEDTYNLLAPAYDLLASPSRIKSEINALLPRLRAHGVRRLLDAGCAVGSHSIELARHGFTVAGLDLSRAMVREARQRAAKAGVKIRFVRRDLADAASPSKVGTVSGTGGTLDVHLGGDLAYLACHAAGVRVLDVSDRASPRVVGRFDDDDGGEALAVWGDGVHLYVADNFGIEVLDLSDPTQPEQIAEYGGVSGAHDLAVVGPFVYVAEGRKGLIVFEFRPPLAKLLTC